MKLRTKLEMKLIIQLVSFIATIAALPSSLTTPVLPITIPFDQLPPQCSIIPRDSCEFYSECLEKRFQCGPKGYALSYGGKFCNDFTTHLPKFSKKGKQWVSDVKICLQNALVPTLKEQVVPTCSVIKKRAFKTHPKCYVDSGVCSLPPGDWAELAKTIGFKTLFEVETVQQAIAVVPMCAGEILKVLFHFPRKQIDALNNTN